MNSLENLLYWCERVVQYLVIKRVAIGLTETEQQILDGLREAIKQITDIQE